MQFLWQSVVWFTLFLRARSQTTVTTWKPYQPLPTAALGAVSGNGTFLWPDLSKVQFYAIGSVMNISWTSTFSRVNLFAVANFDFANPVALTTNVSMGHWGWTVDCADQCSVPWLIRAVDADGDQKQQLTGGFVSAEFWIGSNGTTITRTIQVNTAHSTSTSTIQQSSTIRTYTIDISRGPGASSTGSSESASGFASLTTSPAESSSASSASTAVQSGSSDSSSAPLGVNAADSIGLGLSVGIAAMAFGWILL